MNQTRVVGPKILPTRAVPLRWIKKIPTKITMVIGTMYGAKKGVATCKPSTAESTEMAGVMIPSP